MNSLTEGLAKIDQHRLSGRGNGPFGPHGPFLGVIIHVNESGSSPGTSVSWFADNPGEITPNFQVFTTGETVQFLPFDWQPWCQIDGNFQYAAIENGGNSSEPMTDAQLDSNAVIIAEYARLYGEDMLVVTNTPGARGIGTHQMGGESWGGHACPGGIRAAQRPEIIRRAKLILHPVTSPPKSQPTDPGPVKNGPVKIPFPPPPPVHFPVPAVDPLDRPATVRDVRNAIIDAMNTLVDGEKHGLFGKQNFHWAGKLKGK